MVLFPKGGLGRFLIAVIILTTIVYLVLNLVSFGGNRWISYTDVPVRFGLWRVCDTTTSGLCNYWNQDFVSNVTSNVFSGSKPSFVRSAQGLEIVSLIFYIFAALFIILGIINLPAFPYRIAFAIAAVLLFLCIIFLSASLGVMSTKGRDNHPGAFLDWAWWNGLVGLIFTIICCFSLIFLLIYMDKSAKSNEIRPQMQRNVSQNKSFLRNSSMNNYPMINPILQANISNDYFPHQMNYVEQNPPINMNMYSSMNINPYSYETTSPSPLITELFREYVNQINDQQYETQLIDSYSFSYYL